MIAKSLKIRNIFPNAKDGLFTKICQDILASETSRVGSRSSQEKVKEAVAELVIKHC
jgi:hypothetical protein